MVTEVPAVSSLARLVDWQKITIAAALCWTVLVGLIPVACWLIPAGSASAPDFLVAGPAFLIPPAPRQPAPPAPDLPQRLEPEPAA